MGISELKKTFRIALFGLLKALLKGFLLRQFLLLSVITPAAQYRQCGTQGTYRSDPEAALLDHIISLLGIKQL
jgi:hypothetical protein